VQAGFEPLVGGFVRVPFNDLATVRQIGEHDRSVVAVLVEPIQGEGGINVSTNEYLRGLREVCDEHGWLLMLDEVQCGIGRSGKWFVYQHADFLPDVLTLAKGLGSGVPIGACLARGAAAEVFKPGNHGSTFGGNPLASAAALATLSIIEDEALIPNTIEMGALIRDGIAEGLKGNAGLRAIRGRGLMIGVELDRPCGDLVTRALERQLLINVTVDNVVRLLPPLTINRDEAGQLVSILVSLIREFLAQPLPQPAVKA